MLWAALLGLGCNEDPSPPSVGAGLAPAAAGPCTEAAQRACSRTIAQQGEVLSCYHGVQRCVQGSWGACEHGQVVAQAAPQSGNLTGDELRDHLALSLPTGCIDNPCDPRCQIFIEDPPDIIAMGGAAPTPTTFASNPPPDWSTGSGTTACAHGLCEEGDALDSSCHACVWNVCEVEPNCCSDTGGVDWDQSCVDLAYTECAGLPPQPPIPSNHACNYGLFAEEGIRLINSGSVRGGYVGTNATGAPWHLDIGGVGMSVDRVISAGNIQVGAGATIGSGVTTSGSITNAGTINGVGEDDGVPFSPLTLPSRPVSCIVANTSFTSAPSTAISDGDTRVFQPTPGAVFTFEGPGSFGGFYANAQTARLVFEEPGVYRFAKFTLNHGSDFTIEVPDEGQVIIENCGDSDAVFYPGGGQFELQGTLRLVKSSGGAADPHQVQLYTNFQDAIPTSATALQGLTLIAPRARVYSAGNTGPANAMIWARQIDLVTDIDLSSTGMTGEACLEAGLLAPSIQACPISLEVPPLPPTRRNGCLSGEDCQANSRCSDVATSGSCEHSKCIEGVALDAACRRSDPCVERICAIDGSCCEETNGWSCLPGNRCVAAQCGDGRLRGLERCDDANGTSGDGCSSGCAVEPGYVCTGEPSSCRLTVCGDGILEGDEDCDDGDLVPWDGCSATCQLEPSCPSDGGACSSQCGDGMILAGDAEDCDDGNLVDGDGCSSSCTIEPGFTCAAQAGSTDPFIEMPVIYRDFANQGLDRHPDFEHFVGLPLTRQLVAPNLGSDGLPVYTGRCEEGSPINASDCPNLGYWDGWNPSFSGYMTTNQSNFDQWYRPSSRSRAYWDTMRLRFVGSTYRFDPGNDFYPLSGRPQLLSGDGHTLASTGRWENFGFTSEVRSWFVYRGGEQLDFEGDDDVWVFINGRLALDLGGLHQETAGRVTLSGSGALEEWWDPTAAHPGAPNPVPAWPGVYHSRTRDLGLTLGNAYEIALFHAERRAIESNFTLSLTGFFDEPSVCEPTCGDGVIVQGEVCDDGAANGSAGACWADCQGWDAGGTTAGAWGPHCVAMVKSECDAFCGESTIHDCGHGACELGGPLETSCSSCAADVCAFPGLNYCCDPAGSWDAACINMANQACTPPGDRACDYAVLSNGTVHVETFEVSNGLTSGAHVEVVHGPDGPGTTGPIRAPGTVDIQAGSTGSIVAGGAITQSGGSTGALSPYESVERFHITERSFSCGGTGTTHVSSGAHSISPGTYERLRFDDGTELRFTAPGDYFINRLHIIGQVRVVMPDTGAVNIHLCEELEFVGWGWPTTVGPSMELASGGAPSALDASRFRFFINGTTQSAIANFAEFWGMLFLPHSGIYVGSRAWVHGLVHAEGAIRTNWHGHVNGNRVTGANCLAAQIVDGIDRGASTCDYALLGVGSTTVIGGTVRGGDATAGGSMTVDPIVADCAPPGTGSCSYTPSIEGNATTAGAFSGCPYVSGSCETNLGVAHSLPSIRTRSLSCPSTGPAVTLRSGDSFPPGSYGTVTILPGERVALEEGTYAAENFVVGDGAMLALPASGTVNLNVCGRVTVGDNVNTVGATSSADALRFQIYSASSEHTPLPGPRESNAISIGRQSRVFAALTAPSGGVLLDEWAELFGFVHASEAIILNGATLDATGAAGTSCAYNPGFGECHALNIENTTPTVDDEGLCLENEENFIDSSCTGVDLAVDFGCDEFVPVCNHGMADAPAGVELTFYPRAGHQFASTSPDPSWAIGTCSVTEPIPAGSCISQACDPDLTRSQVTVVANIDERIAECSLLDNWSLKDPAETCPTVVPEPVVLTEIYQAACPAESRPIWGLLTWNTQTPGDSTVDFEGRISGTSGGLSSEAYSPFGVAAQAPNDTQRCQYLSSLTECPVDVAAFLPPSSANFSNVTSSTTGVLETVSFLELRISLAPTANDAPILEDWNLTYSCVYDQ